MPQRWLERVALLLPAAAVLLALGPFADVDPVDGFTFSNSPFTDEAWWLANARNFAHFGAWSTDEWNLHLVSPVYSAAHATALAVGGVNMIAARWLVIIVVGLTCIALAFGLRRHFGPWPAVVAAAGYGLSLLVVYYGRLAYLEPMVALALLIGVLAVSFADERPAWLWGVVGGGFLALAIGVKPTALPLVAGAISGTLFFGPRTGWGARWAGAAVVAVALAAAAWLVIVIVPQREAVAVVGRILAEVTLPDDAGELLYRVLAYPLSNDRALLYSLPLLVGAAAGVAALFRAQGALPPSTRRLLAAAAGWLVVGIVVLMVIPYRPNRYFLPLLPAAAILTAGGLWWLTRSSWWQLRSAASKRALLISATLALVVPGLLVHGLWMAAGTRQLVPLQSRVASVLPPGAVVEGAYAPLLAFRAPVVTIVSRPESDVNAGDLYATRGVRWVVVEDGEPPAWAAAHEAAWTGRREVLCEPWGRVELCLVNVP